MNVIDMSGLNLLVADSNHYMRKIIRAMLRGFGITNIREAADGALALEELNTHLIDLMIADYALETLNGVELTELIRGAEDSHNRFVPIIMLSAYTEKWRIEGARDAGVTEFLRKPLCAQDLYLRLQEVIMHPRSFVRTPRYFGPDRRRRVTLSASTPARRAEDALVDRASLLNADPNQSTGPAFGKRPPIINEKSAEELANELFA
jgi:two-component system, chemotaxis family, chemotaxis protein CheY